MTDADCTLGREPRSLAASLLLLSEFCISTTERVLRCAQLIDVIFPFRMKLLVATYLSLVDLLVCK